MLNDANSKHQPHSEHDSGWINSTLSKEG
jgi:hypothetical protein